MNEVINSAAINGLTIACICLFLLGAVACYFAWKKNQEQKATALELQKNIDEMKKVLEQQGLSIDIQAKEMGRNYNYNKAMSQISAEKQRTCLYVVASLLDAFTKENELQQKYGLISEEVMKLRNTPLLSLKSNMYMSADMIGHTITSTSEQQEKITA